MTVDMINYHENARLKDCHTHDGGAGFRSKQGQGWSCGLRAVGLCVAFEPLTLEGERGAPVNVRARLRRPFFGTAGKTTRSFPAYLSSSTEAESVPLCRGESEREGENGPATFK